MRDLPGGPARQTIGIGERVQRLTMLETGRHGRSGLDVGANGDRIRGHQRHGGFERLSQLVVGPDVAARAGDDPGDCGGVQ